MTMVPFIKAVNKTGSVGWSKVALTLSEVAVNKVYNLLDTRKGNANGKLFRAANRWLSIK
jgi:hypothetical protein